jgi:hypothetical protein
LACRRTLAVVRSRNLKAIAAGLFLVASSPGCGSSGSVPAARPDFARPAGWGRAVEVSPPAPNSGFAVVSSISCGAAGDCAVGGYYERRPYNRAFVVSETSGTWGDATRVPGAATLSGEGGSEVLSISCAAAGECAAGGYYSYDLGSSRQALVVNEANGSWGSAIEVPGTATLDTGDRASVTSISCVAAGDCAGGGYYLDADSGDYEAFVVSETNGRWGTAIALPGTATPASNVDFEDVPGVISISCAAAGECAGVGSYYDSRDDERAFVVSETDGRWGTVVGVPGAAVDSVSCGAAGECDAGGSDSNGQAFVISETNGGWGKPIEVPGMAAVNTGEAGVASISCVAAGECVAGGSYDHGHARDDDIPYQQAFVVSETHGNWGKALEVPGTAAFNSGLTAAGDDGVDSVSCVAVGECAAVGRYSDGHSNLHFFVVSETNGGWGTAIKVPGTARLRGGEFSDPMSISCVAAGGCVAGGDAGARAFVVSEVCLVPNLVGKPGNRRGTRRRGRCSSPTAPRARWRRSSASR